MVILNFLKLMRDKHRDKQWSLFGSSIRMKLLYVIEGVLT